jgi:hypothetical protein
MAHSGAQKLCHGLRPLHHVVRIAVVMDMSFARRRKVPKNTDTPDLPVLLAEMSAKQGASRTALIQSRLQSPTAEPLSDPVVAIFAPDGQPAAATHRFSDQIANPVIPRKLK